MIYKKLELEDIPQVGKFFNMVHTRSCDYSIGGLFMWRDYYRMEYSIENGVFFSRLYDKNGKCYYNIPIGQDIKRCIRKLIKEEGKLAFCTVPESMLEVFKSLDFTINVIEQPDFADYLYNSSDLIHLRGKKLSSKRNQIHQFLRENDLWSYETISDDIIQETKVFLTTEYKIAYSISCPFIISIFFDNTIRNQIIVINNEKEENLYDYLYRTFKISKSGSPKIYSVIPKSRQCLSDEQIGSLLSGETIYSDGDNFGKIIDKDIMDAVNSEYGMGQYNRGFVLAYLNVVLQFSDNQRSSIKDRIYEAMITQFYIELIMFKEAAINLTDIAITKLLANSEIENTISYLEKAEKINENYAKTICFWDINVNYPTSQKSIDMLRNSFALKRHLKKMERNKAQLQAVYDAKCEIIDRKDSKRIDSSLAVLAVLAIFSALIDSFDYIGVWASYFPAKFIKTLQILNSSVIVLIGLYVIIRLYGSNMLKRLKSLMHKSN